MTHAPLHTRLPQLSRPEAEARNQLLAALDGLTVDGLRLRARVVEPQPGQVVMVFAAAGAGELSLAAELVAGQPAQRLELVSPALPEALTEMSRLEPLIAAVERACGRPLEPQGLAGEAGRGISLRLDVCDAAGQPVHAARITVPEALVPAFQPAPGRLLGPAAHALTRCRLTLRGPLAPRHELDLLEDGDVVVLPDRMGGGRTAWLEAGNLIHRGIFDPAQAAFHVHQEDPDMLDAPPSGDSITTEPPAEAHTPEADAARVAELPVRLQVVLPAVEMSVGALAALAPGAVAPLPIDGEDIRVELLAEGVKIATGRLVALGQAYGVLIDQLAER